MRLARHEIEPGIASLFLPSALLFFTGFCVMVVELVASRLVSRYIGASLYTWTTVIGVILAGISLGSYLGGWIADRVDVRRLAAALVFAAGAFTLWVAPVTDFLGQHTHDWIYSQSTWTARMLIVVSGGFFVPGVVFGMISPSIVKWALDRGFATGGTVGALYFWNNLGCILGTFVTGFFLFWKFEVDRILLLVAVGLMIVGIVFLIGGLFSKSRAIGTTPGGTRDAAPTLHRTEPRGRLLVPCFLVFLSGFCIMMIEMVASRLVAVHIGQSLFTWTSVIGVILAGISIGNRLGGRLADLYDPKELVGSLFLISSILAVSILTSHLIIANATRDWMGRDWFLVDWLGEESATWAVRVFLVVFAAFFFPAAALGTISPVVAKWALDQGIATGRTVGIIYAWNTIGSIVGTFATGYFLISMFYVSRLVAASGLMLAIFALIFSLAAGTWMMRLVSTAWLAVAALVLILAAVPRERFHETVLALWPVPVAAEPDNDTAAREREERNHVRLVAQLVSRADEINIWEKYNFRDDFEDYDESNYYTIQVGEDTFESNQRDDFEKDSATGKIKKDANGEPVLRRRSLRKLVLDALVHGYMDMNDYKYLHYEYEHLYATVSHRILKKHEREGQPLRVLFLGGGSYTFPRYLSEFYKNIRCEVAEIDPRVTQTVMRSMGMNQARGKRFYLLVDEAVPAAPSAERPAGLAARAQALVTAFRPDTSPRRLRERFGARLRAAGAHVATQFTNATDVVLDLRANPSAANEVVQKAAERKVPVIAPAELEQMLHQTSHPNVVTFHMDARQFIMQNKDDGKYDVIYGDAFNDFSVPAHLCTLEFNQEMARLLKPDGVFMANVIDIWSKSRFMGAYFNTLRRVFKHVYLLSTDEERPGHRRATFVLICSQQPIDLSDLGKRAEDQGLTTTVIDGALLRPVIRGGLFPSGRVTLVADGKQKSFALPEPCHDVGILFENKPEPVSKAAYRVENGVIFFDEATGPRKGTRLRATFRGDKQQVLAREYFVAPGPGKTHTLQNASRFEMASTPPVSGGEATTSAPVKASTDSEKGPAKDGAKASRPALAKADSKSAVGKGAARSAIRIDLDRELRVPVDDGDYQVEGGKNILFREPPPEGTRMRVTMYTDRPVVLTDKYCPVDNLCGEVAATRAAD